MSDNFCTENLKVGDKVIVTVWHYATTHYVGEIIKKTPTGMVDVRYANRTERFKKSGREYARGDGYGRRSTHLEVATEERIKEVEAESKHRFLLKFCKEFDYSKLSIGELQEVYQIIKSKV